jgi:hypothetical protein
MTSFMGVEFIEYCHGLHEGEMRRGLRRGCSGWSKSGMGGGRKWKWRGLSDDVIQLWEYKNGSDDCGPFEVLRRHHVCGRGEGFIRAVVGHIRVFMG